MPHRPPTRHDIGKTVEVEIEGAWIQTILQEVNSSYVGTFCGLSDYLQHFDIALVRVPYTTPDPIAELAQAADWLAERGMDEAARVLMAFASLNDNDCAGRIRAMPGDTEGDHIDADALLCEMLRRLGFNTTADAFVALEKWYA